MKQFSRKGNTTVQARNSKGVTHPLAVGVNSKLARIQRHKKRQIERARRERINQYKQKLRDAKKRFPIEERSKLRLEDL